MLEILTERYASTRTSTSVVVLNSTYTKHNDGKTSMSKYIDDFNSLFSQSDAMGTDTVVTDTHKPIMRIESLGTNSLLECTLSALLLKEEID